MKIKIVVDSTADMNDDIIKKYKFTVVPLTVNLGDNSFKDGVTITTQGIFDYVKKTGDMPKTAAPSVEEYKKVFTSFTEKGYEVIHFNISAELSCSYQNACLAAEGLTGIYVIDSRSASAGTALLVIYAAELINKEYSASDIVDMVKMRIPFVRVSFVIDSLNYLRKGGRCSAITLLGANLLKLKPTIFMKDGKTGVGKKYRGKYIEVVKQHARETLDNLVNPDLSRAFITHTLADEEIVDAVKQVVKEHSSFKEVLETTTGATIASHCGQNAIGILCIDEPKKE